jgi:signal transduction histidine kinase
MNDMQLNARYASHAAETIRRTQREAERLSLLLNVAAVLVTMGAALALVGGLRRKERFAAEQARLQEERTAEMEQFAARVAHDIRSPVAAVLLALELSERHPDSKKWIAKARKGLGRVEQIVDALYQFAVAGAKPERGLCPDAAEVVTDVVDSLREPAAEAQLELSADTLLREPVACPPGVVATLLVNLVQNAIKYTGGVPGRVQVSMERAGSLVRFRVSDTGPGLPPGAEAKVFHPYVRVEQNAATGLGLGLATVKRLSEGYGGACGVESTPGKGASFWFDLPLASPLSEKTPPRADETERPIDTPEESHVHPSG